MIGLQRRKITSAALFHDDPVNLMGYVTWVFMKVFGYPEARARKHMLEVHHNGRSIVWTGQRERAEMYAEQLHSHLLLATIERAEGGGK